MVGIEVVCIVLKVASSSNQYGIICKDMPVAKFGKKTLIRLLDSYPLDTWGYGLLEVAFDTK